MISVLLLNTVSLLEVVACPTVGSQTPPELQPALAASPSGSPCCTEGSAEVSWLDALDNRRRIMGTAAAHSILPSLPHFIKKKENLSQ